MKLAVLDDWQGVASGMADWSRLPEGTEVRFLRTPFPDPEAVNGGARPLSTSVDGKNRPVMDG